MATLLVSFVLRHPEIAYDELAGALATFESWSRPLDHTFLLVTDVMLTDVRDTLMRHIYAEDQLLVVDVTSDGAAWYNLHGAEGEAGQRYL